MIKPHGVKWRSLDPLAPHGSTHATSALRWICSLRQKVEMKLFESSPMSLLEKQQLKLLIRPQKTAFHLVPSILAFWWKPEMELSTHTTERLVRTLVWVEGYSKFNGSSKQTSVWPKGLFNIFFPKPNKRYIIKCLRSEGSIQSWEHMWP